MKNLVTYYIAILAPLLLFAGLEMLQNIDSRLFVAFIFSYALLYRTYTDGTRLAEKGVIDKKDIWKTSWKGYQVQYFRELYFR